MECQLSVYHYLIKFTPNSKLSVAVSLEIICKAGMQTECSFMLKHFHLMWLRVAECIIVSWVDFVALDNCRGFFHKLGDRYNLHHLRKVAIRIAYLIAIICFI